MPTRRLDRSEWQSYMDRVSKNLPASKVGIRIDGLDIGDQVEAESLPLVGLSYDPSDDTIEVAARDLAHHITHPREVFVQEEEGSLKSLEVTDSDGHTQIIILDRVLALPRA